MKRLSLKLQLAIFLFGFLGCIAYQESSIVPLAHALLAVAISAVVDGLLAYRRTKIWKLSESALITGLLIGFVLSADASWGSIGVAAFLAILSKHVIRFQGKHVFNPAACGALAVVLLFQENTRWYGSELWYIVVPVGLYFVWKINRLGIVSAFYLIAAAAYGLQAGLQKTGFIDEMMYLNHFFVLFMLIEPRTSPFIRPQQIGYGFLAGLLCYGLSVVRFPLSAELPVLLFVNVLFSFLSRKRTLK